MKKEELKEILELHKQWLQDRSKGKRANLYNAYLYNADLSNTDLRNVFLANADLRNVDLENANLRYANLSNANLRYADLSNAILPDDIPLVKDIKSKISKENLNMNYWHSDCGTTHCLAGWACTLAGNKELEKKYSTKTLGALIFQRSVGEIPNFYSSNEEALEWLDAK